MKANLLTTIALLTVFAVPALAEAPAGAAAANCDITQFTAIRGDDGQVLYWNNPTCAGSGGGSSFPVAAPASQPDGAAATPAKG